MPTTRLNRRAFLRLALAAGLGAGVIAVDQSLRPVGAARLLWWLVQGRARQLSRPQAVVGLGKCSSYGDDVLACLQDLWQVSDMPDVTGKRVLVKPNLVDSVEGYPVTTAPEVTAAVVDLLQMRGAGEIVVADGPAFRRDAWRVAEASGLAQLLEARQVPFVDLNYDDPKPVPTRNGWYLKERELWLPRHVREADLIVSIPKLKTHHWAGLSLSLKNLFGVVPGLCYGWPKNLLHINGLQLSVLGLYDILPPVVSVVDGIVGMEGDGPLFGSPVAHGLLALGSDAVAVDVTCARLMGFSVEEVPHLLLAQLSGAGHTEGIELRGAAESSLRRVYEPPPS